MMQIKYDDSLKNQKKRKKKQSSLFAMLEMLFAVENDTLTSFDTAPQY